MGTQEGLERVSDAFYLFHFTVLHLPKTEDLSIRRADLWRRKSKKKLDAIFSSTSIKQHRWLLKLTVVCSIFIKCNNNMDVVNLPKQAALKQF